MKRKTVVLFMSVLFAFSHIMPVLAEEAEVVEEFSAEPAGGTAQEMETGAETATPDVSVEAVEVEEITAVAGEAMAQAPSVEGTAPVFENGTETVTGELADAAYAAPAEPETAAPAAPETEAAAAPETETASASEAAYAAGNSMTDATAIQIGAGYAGTLSAANTQDFYKFTLDNSGRVALSARGTMKKVTYRLFDETGNKLWGLNDSWNKVVEMLSTDKTLDLTRGTYYLAIVRKDTTGKGDGNYSFSLSFMGAGESFAEAGRGMNNSMETASPIMPGVTYAGQISLNDVKDFYHFAIAAPGRVSLSATSDAESIHYQVYDSTGKKLWAVNPVWDAPTRMIVTNEFFDLTAGDYYLVVKKDTTFTGNYSFSFAAADAGETFAEAGAGTNNTIYTANDIMMDTAYVGQLSENDGKDFYRFSLNTSGLLTLNATAGMDGIYYVVYNQAGEQLWKSKQVCKDGSGKIDTSEIVELDAGIYYLAAVRQSGYTGSYTFQLSLHVHNFVKEVVKATPEANGSVTEKCSCGEVGATEIIYYPQTLVLSQDEYTYTGRVKKPSLTVIGSDGNVIDKSNYTVVYSSGRTKVGTYSVRANFKGNYKGFKRVTFVINPRKTSVSKLTPLTAGFTVTLKKYTTQTTGYQVQYSTNKNFSGAVTSTTLKNTKTSVTYKGLTSNKRYYVRVRTYRNAGGKQYYSAWSDAKSVVTK